MGAAELFILILMCVGVAVFLLWAITSPEQHQRFDPSTLDLDAAADVEVQAFLREGDKLNAIRVYRALSGDSLQEASQAIAFLAANPNFAASPKSKRLSGGTPFDTGIREMVRTGNKQEAIKIYREFTGASLTDAHDEIERIEWEESHAARQNGRA
jgi:ribosomal protein L7/L12